MYGDRVLSEVYDLHEISITADSDSYDYTCDDSISDKPEKKSIFFRIFFCM